jgi:hypothetical protein
MILNCNGSVHREGSWHGLTDGPHPPRGTEEIGWLVNLCGPEEMCLHHTIWFLLVKIGSTVTSTELLQKVNTIRDCASAVLHTLQFTRAHTARCLVTASNGGSFISFGFPNCSRSSAIATLYWFPDWLPTYTNFQFFWLSYQDSTNQLTVLPITFMHWPQEKHCYALLYSHISVQTCLFAKSLLSNGCLIHAESTVLAFATGINAKIHDRFYHLPCIPQQSFDDGLQGRNICVLVSPSLS